MKKLNIETIKTNHHHDFNYCNHRFYWRYTQYQRTRLNRVKTEAATIVKNVKVEVSKQ